MLPHFPLIRALPTIIVNLGGVEVPTPSISVNRASTEHPQSINRVGTQGQQSIDNFHHWMFINSRDVLLHFPIMKELPTIMGHMLSFNVTSFTNERQQSINRASAERQQRVNNFQCCILYNPSTELPHVPIIKDLLAVMCHMLSGDVATPTSEHQQSVNTTSPEH